LIINGLINILISKPLLMGKLFEKYWVLSSSIS
jgi:hypothetical protein